MKKFLLIIVLSMAIPSSSVHGQSSDLQNWWNNIKKTASRLQKTEKTYLKKEILYNGSIVPVAYGELSYKGDDSSTVTLPFLYTYGRITVDKDEFEKMMAMPDSTKVDVLVSFKPVRTSEYQKKIDGPTSISFTLSRNLLHYTYFARENVWLVSYWAITTMKDCYLVHYLEHNMFGWRYYIPYENSKRKRFEKKLDRLYNKQYHEGFSLLNYFW